MGVPPAARARAFKSWVCNLIPDKWPWGLGLLLLFVIFQQAINSKVSAPIREDWDSQANSTREHLQERTCYSFYHHHTFWWICFQNHMLLLRSIVSYCCRGTCFSHFHTVSAHTVSVGKSIGERLVNPSVIHLVNLHSNWRMEWDF